LSEHRLSATLSEGGSVLRHVASELHGSEAGDWDPFGEPADMPPDQRGEDGLCLTFSSDPLDQPLDLLGVPVARLAVAVDRPVVLELDTAGSALVLPERRAIDEPELDAFDRPELAPRPQVEVVRLEGGDHTLARSIASGEQVLVHRYPHQRAVLPNGVEVESR